MSTDNLNETCRLCLSLKEQLRDLFDESLKKKVEQTLNINLVQNNFWPGQICGDCEDVIEKYFDYRQSVRENQSQLFDRFPEEVKTEGIKEEYEVLKVEADIAIDESPSSPVSNGDNEDSPYVPEENEEPESEEEKYEKKVTRKRKAAEKDTLEPKQRKKKTTKKEDGSEKRANSLSAEEMDSIIKKFMPIKCDFCPDEEFESTLALYRHSKSTHKEVKRGFRMRCSLCKNVYNARHEIYYHILYHQNPDRFKCSQCDKVFRNKSNLILHETKHLPVEELPIACQKCDKRFKFPKQLTKHMVYHTPKEERKFSCDQCGHRYLGQDKLRQHIQVAHTTARPFVCEICARSFNLLPVLKRHIEIHNRQKFIQCTQCPKWLVDEGALRHHVRMIHAPKADHKCEICGHNSPNRKALMKHKHRNHDPTAPTYTCRLCGKVVKTKTMLQEHESTHTGERMHKCLFCPKDFISNGSKYRHQKKKHLVEWEKWKHDKIAPFL